MQLKVLLIGSVGLFAACSQSASPQPEAMGGQVTTNSSAGGDSQANAETGGSSGSQTTGGTSDGGKQPSSGGTGAVGGGSSSGSVTMGGSRTSGGTTALGGKTATGGTSSGTGQIRTGGSTSSGGTSVKASGSSTGGVSNPGGASSAGGSAAGGTAPGVGGSSASCADQPGSLNPTYPFPQNYRSAKCIYPTSACSSDARDAYNLWKEKLVVPAGEFQRVNRPDLEAGLTNSTVSEGIGYGMILAAIMDDQTLFDDLWQYSQQHLNKQGLMIWIIDSSGNPGTESSGMPASGSATDADEDIAWGLALAAQKWGNSPTLGSYKTLAVNQIGRVYASEADTRHDLLNAGDSWGTTFAWNPSYFAPNEYRVFAKLDTAHAEGWNKLIDKGYEVLAASQNSASGLVPAWTDTGGKPAAAWSGGPTHYQYDAARVPFRIALDYCEYGDQRAAAILGKLTTFFSGIGADKIVDGYALDGTPQPENTKPEGVQSALFMGAAGVGAMATKDSAFVNAVYERLVKQPDEMTMPVSTYFNRSWKVFTLIMMSGNMFEYSLHP